jgi:hypothetical protein
LAQDLVLQSLLAEQPLEFADLLLQRAVLGRRHYSPPAPTADNAPLAQSRRQ